MAREQVQGAKLHGPRSMVLAGCWDLGLPDERAAGASCALLLSAADQSSIDGGSWLLAQQVLMESPPPYHSFATHQNRSIHERQHTALLDSRWLDLLLHHVKELDSYQEAKRRLGGIRHAQKCFNACACLFLNSTDAVLPDSPCPRLASLTAPPQRLELWSSFRPLPVPYTEALRKQWKASDYEAARKKMLNVVAIILNYTTLGRASSCPAHLLPGKPLNAVQWGIVRRLEALLEDWLVAGKVGPESMGRAAPKIECVENALDFLRERVAHLVNENKNDYFGARNAFGAPGNPGFSGDTGEVVGSSSSPLFSTFKELDPSRLRFVGTPSFDREPYLDTAGARVYQHPLECRLPVSDFTGRAPLMRMHCSFPSKTF